MIPHKAVYFYILKVLLKKFKFFLSFSLLQIIFYFIFRSFWCADIKNDFLKIKKILFWYISSEKYFEKQPQPQPHFQIDFQICETPKK